MPRARATRTTKPKSTPSHSATEHLAKGGTHLALLERNLPVVAQSHTFARLVQPNLRFLPNLKDLRWLFPPLCERKDQAALTENEKARFICAFNMINADGTLGQLVDIHHQMHMQHSNARLLPWHRVYLHLFEEALHNYHPDVCVPYWDWTRAEEQHFPDWLAGVLPTIHTPTRTINVIRAPASEGGLAAIASGVPSAMAKTSYATFTAPINGIHGLSTSGWAARCRMPLCLPRTPCSGSITPTSIGSGGSGTTARKAIIRTRHSWAATQ